MGIRRDNFGLLLGALAACAVDSEPGGVTAVNRALGDDQAVIAELVERADELGLCDLDGRPGSDIDDQAARDHSRVFRRDGQQLVILQCAPGVYQGESEVVSYRRSGRERRVTSLPLQVQRGARTGWQRVVVGELDLDPRAGELTVWTRSRGLGDCGRFAEYALVERGFYLLREREKATCDGRFQDPSTYPLVHEAPRVQAVLGSSDASQVPFFDQLSLLYRDGTVVTLRADEFNGRIRHPDIERGSAELIDSDVTGVRVLDADANPRTGRVAVALQAFLFAETSFDFVLLLDASDLGRGWIQLPRAGIDARRPTESFHDVTSVAYDASGRLTIVAGGANGAVTTRTFNPDLRLHRCVSRGGERDHCRR
jgi:hypothetical protein